jgi:hypothetical protein
MRSYWFKIVAGALGVFVVGLVVWAGGRGAWNVVEGAGPLAIPLPFDIVPFQVDGQRLGSLKKVVFHREAPQQVKWVEVDAELSSSDRWAELSQCRLTLDDLEDLDENSTFVCHAELPEGYVEFGEVRFRGNGESLLLWIPSDIAENIRHRDRSQIERQHARMVREQVRVAEVQAQLIAERTNVEVAATVARAMAEAFGDSIPAEVLEELRAAGIATESASEVRVVAPSVRVEVRTADSADAVVEVAP